MLKGDTKVPNIFAWHLDVNAPDSKKGHVGWFHACNSSNRVVLRLQENFSLEWRTSLRPDAKWYTKTFQSPEVNLI